MAFEDRCSPQNAPSPPGIPHSPQSTSSPSILDMSLHSPQHNQNNNINNKHNNTSTTDIVDAVATNFLHNNLNCDKTHKKNINELSSSSSSTTSSLSPSPSTVYMDSKMSLSIRNNYDDRLSPQTEYSDEVATIKEEEDSIISDQDQDNDLESTISDGHHHHQLLPPPPSSSSHRPPPLPVISFSISNILSDRYGKRLPSTEKKSNKTIFRPFEVSTTTTIRSNNVKNISHNKTSNNDSNSNNDNNNISNSVNNSDNDTTSNICSDQNPSAFSRFTTEVIDYSRTHAAILNSQHHAHAAMIAERANLLNCFNPAAYPRIHEEILNNARKFKHYPNHLVQNPHHHPLYPLHPHHNPHHQQFTDIKMPPLGSLCKTVSQIGQSSLNSSSSSSAVAQSTGLCVSSPPPIAISESTSPSSSSIASACRLQNSPQPIPPQQSISRDSGMESSDDTRSESGSTKDENGQPLWPAWVYCTRYSDRPSSGPRYRRPKKPKDKAQVEEKRPRTAFSSEQLARLKREFNENRYLTERRRQQLSSELGLNEAQIKIWFQNKRAKIKKASGTKNPLALQLMAQGLYNHSTVPLTKEEEELEMRMNGQL